MSHAQEGGCQGPETGEQEEVGDGLAVSSELLLGVDGKSPLECLSMRWLSRVTVPGGRH